ncbi:DNA translocase FtsK [Haloplasma contractile]|uniref:FtsK domain protein n=1 Tax=Haloplasma contractile SSD-17B TaxID=1033810 RepID=U2FLS0_9MOLU|nr:DNA translocase FtsK [Haloplasma contractile]ERJ13695.1 FtsK domain protein [Haloplasma contractile SSD-17B]
MSKEKSRKLVNDETKEGLIYFEIWGIALILLSIIIISELGTIGAALYVFIKFAFGDWYWLILIYQFYYGIMLILYHEFPTYKLIKIRGLLFILSGILINSHFAIYHTVNNNDGFFNIIGQTWNVYMTYLDDPNADLITGGGIVGAVLFQVVYTLLGTIGTYFIAYALLLFGVAYVFERTIYDLIGDLYDGITGAISAIRNRLLNEYKKMKDVSKKNKEVKKTKFDIFDHNKEVEDTELASDAFFDQKLTLDDEDEIRGKDKKNGFTVLNPKILDTYDNKNILDGQKELTIGNAKVINSFLSEFNLHLEVNEIYIGPTVSTYIIYIDESYKTKKFFNFKEDLELKLNSKSLRAYHSIEERRTLVIEVPNKYRYKISLREVLEERKRGKKTGLPIGRDYRGKLKTLNLERNKNILVVGNDLDSKVNFLKCFLLSILYTYTPEEFEVVIFDSTKYELNDFSKLDHLFYEFTTLFKTCTPLFIKLYTEIRQRFNLFQKYSCSTIDEYNERNKEKQMKPIVLIINDFSDLYLNRGEYLNYLNYIMNNGNKVGIYLLFATSTISDNLFKSHLKSSFQTIVSFMLNEKELSLKLIEEDATKLLKHGDCLIYERDGNTSKRTQIATISDDDITNSGL